MPVRKIKLVGNPHRKRNAKGQFKRRIKARKNRRPAAKVHRRRRVTRQAVHKNARSVVRRRKRSGNPSLVLMGLNPIRGGSHMARKRKVKKVKRNRSRLFGSRHGLKRNPHVRHYRQRKHNPFGFNWTQFVGLAGAAIVGGIGTRAIPEYFAPSYNQGPTGYLLNALVAGGGAYLVSLIDKTWALGVAVGGAVMIAGRVASDYFGKTLVTFASITPGTNVAQPTASVAAPASTLSGLAGDLPFNLRGSLGKYAQSYFALPTSSQQGKDALVQGKPWASDIQSALAAKAAKKQGSAVSLKSGRYAMLM